MKRVASDSWQFGRDWPMDESYPIRILTLITNYQCGIWRFDCSVVLCLQWRVRLVWSCVGYGWLMMRKVSQTGSLALHFQTTSRGVGFTVFNQRFTHEDSLSTSTQWNLMTTTKLGWPFILLLNVGWDLYVLHESTWSVSPDFAGWSGCT